MLEPTQTHAADPIGDEHELLDLEEVLAMEDSEFEL